MADEQRDPVTAFRGVFKDGLPSDELVERSEEALIAARDHLIAGRADEALAVIESALGAQRRPPSIDDERSHSALGGASSRPRRSRPKVPAFANVP